MPIDWAPLHKPLQAPLVHLQMVTQVLEIDYLELGTLEGRQYLQLVLLDSLFVEQRQQPKYIKQLAGIVVARGPLPDLVQEHLYEPADIALYQQLVVLEQLPDEVSHPDVPVQVLSHQFQSGGEVGLVLGVVPYQHRQVIVYGVQALQVDLVAIGVVHQLDVLQQHQVAVLILDQFLVEGARVLPLAVYCYGATQRFVAIQVLQAVVLYLPPDLHHLY